MTTLKLIDFVIFAAQLQKKGSFLREDLFELFLFLNGDSLACMIAN